MTTLVTFPPRTRTQCCGTCEHWTLRWNRTWCPVLRCRLPGDLTACGCVAWCFEAHETQSVELYQELLSTDTAAPPP